MQETPLTLGNVVDWILANRRGAAFKGWTYEEVAREVYYHSRNSTMLVLIDETKGCIVGYISYIVASDNCFNHYAYIQNMLSTTTGAIHKFLRAGRERYHGAIKYVVGERTNKRTGKKTTIKYELRA